MSSSKSISREIRKILYGSASLLAGLAMTGAAQAQDQAGDDVLEEVVVKGIRASLQQSLATKRDSISVVDAISAEDVGKFPDKNLAEALQRVPGVTINREFGEGERVNLRGTAANLTRTLYNGHALATADWFILDQLNTTRSFNYLMLPSDIIGQVVVTKTPSVDVEEGGIGGNINVVTRNPLDLEKNAVYLSAQGAYTELADEFDPQASAFYSWKNDDDSVGLLLAGLYQERNIRRDGVEVLGYNDWDPGPATLLAPSHIGSALFQQERIRTTGNAKLQLAPSDALDMTLEGLYSKFDADNINENFLAWGVRVLGNSGTLTNTTMVGDTAVAGTMTSRNATAGQPANGTGDFAVVYDAIDRFATAETRNIDLDTKYRPSDDWELHFRVGYTDAEGNTDSQPFVEFGAPGVFSYDLRGSTPQVSFLPNGMGVAVDPTDPTDLQFLFSSLHQILNNDDETYAYADATRDLNAGVLDSLAFGAKYSDHNRELIFNATTYGGFHVPINSTPAATFAGGPTPSDFLDEIAASGTLTEYWQVNRSVVEDLLFANLASGPGRVFYPQQNFSVQETAYAGYVMGNLEGEKWRGNIGVRYVQTDQTSQGNIVGGGSIQNPFGNYDPITVDRTYDDILPQANFVFDLSEQVKLRAAAARVMARPDFTDIAPRTSLNPGALTGTAGNPELDPYRANQADLSVEWYMDQNAYAALAIYYKDIKSFITDSPITQNFNVQSATLPNTACTPVAGQANTFSCPFLINQRSNGGGGKIQGAELAFTTPSWSGFGLTGNYTYTDAEADNGDPIPGSSEDVIGLTAFFENNWVGARLSYTYRSEFFVTFDRTTQLNQDDLASLDAAVNVNVTDNVMLTAEAINITNETIEQFATEQFRPRAAYDNGRIFYVGARLTF